MNPVETLGSAACPDPTAFLSETADGSPAPSDLDAPAEADDRPPWPDDTDGPRLTFAELIDHEALGYRAWGTPVGDFLARHMDELAQLVRWTHATTPDEHDSRKEAWDAEIRRRWEDIGYEEGRRAGCRWGEGRS